MEERIWEHRGIRFKFKMIIRYTTVNADELVVCESLEFRGTVRYSDTKWGILNNT